VLRSIERFDTKVAPIVSADIVTRERGVMPRPRVEEPTEV